MNITVHVNCNNCQTSFHLQFDCEFISAFVVQESLCTSWMKKWPLCAHRIIALTMHVL